MPAFRKWVPNALPRYFDLINMCSSMLNGKIGKFFECSIPVVPSSSQVGLERTDCSDQSGMVIFRSSCGVTVLKHKSESIFYRAYQRGKCPVY
jgi:hypothetical protein